MGNILSYKEEMIKAMELLAQHPKVIFIGQNVLYSGSTIYETLERIDNNRKIELPVFEDTQLGMCIGLSLGGFIPVCAFPRIDFLMCAMNQLVNHLDKIEEMSVGGFKPKVIIRTVIGATKPLNPGPQHSSDYSNCLSTILENIRVYRLNEAGYIVRSYAEALASEKSSILIEYMEKIRA